MTQLRTEACEILACEQPVVLAGMGGVARSELVAAVCNAGGFGILGMVREGPELVRSEIRAVRGLTAGAFGVNLIPAATAPALLAEEVAVCIEEKVHAVALFWDLAPELITRLRKAGIRVLCQVGSLVEAEAAVGAGADIIIVQGVEAGGHVRGREPVASLAPAVIRAIDRPVLVAGGVVDGQGLARVLRWGGQGVVLGTAFIATEESFAHKHHKERILGARPGETLLTEAFHINWPPGAPVRVLPNSVTRGERGSPHSSARIVIGHEGERPIYLFSTDSPLRSMTGELEAMAIYAGEGAGWIDDIVPAAVRLRRIVEQAADELDGLSSGPEPL
jgi:nitronate monooxygenase